MATITLSPALSERVEKIAKERGTDAEALIEELLGPPFVVDEIEAVKEALEASMRGEGRPVEEFFAEHRRKYPDTRQAE